MILVSVSDIQKYFGPEPVLERVTFDIRPGQRVGLVGPNGTGKTTLLRILAGHQEADGGTFEFHQSVKIGYLEQQPLLEPGRSLWDEAKTALADLVSLEHQALAAAEQMSEATDDAEHARLAARYDHLQQELHRQDAYNLDHKVERVLEGLGFAKSAMQTPADALSGGEQNRLGLAKMLLADPEVMLLDEPSNHLDIEATEWLENYLNGSSAAMLLVSHDRYFLDRVTNRTLELFHGTVDDYQGNFSAYWQQKGERLLVQRRTYEKQQIEIEKTKDFIRRNSYGMKSAQAEDRRKKLERIVPVDPPREIESPPMAFPEATRCGDIVVRAEHLSKSYDVPLFQDLTFDVERGQRWAILGPNGSGKTTLLRCLLDEVQPDKGTIRLGQGVVIGYFDQQLQMLDDATPVMDAIRPDGIEMNEPARRNLLARFGIAGDTALQPVGSLSGGERCRAALARLAAASVNVLVLDEPTNHLDLWARDSLEQAMAAFGGTVLFVSHDRYFVNQVADRLLVVEPDRFRVIDGNYSTYIHLIQQGMAADPNASTKPSGATKQSKARPDKEPAKRKRRFTYRKVADIESEIFERETEIEELTEALTLPETHRDGELVKQCTDTIAAQQLALKELYEHWEEATDLNW